MVKTRFGLQPPREPSSGAERESGVREPLMTAKSRPTRSGDRSEGSSEPIEPSDPEQFFEMARHEHRPWRPVDSTAEGSAGPACAATLIAKISSAEPSSGPPPPLRQVVERSPTCRPIQGFGNHARRTTEDTRPDADSTSAFWTTTNSGYSEAKIMHGAVRNPPRFPVERDGWQELRSENCKRVAGDPKLASTSEAAAERRI